MKDSEDIDSKQDAEFLKSLELKNKILKKELNKKDYSLIVNIVAHAITMIMIAISLFSCSKDEDSYTGNTGEIIGYSEEDKKEDSRIRDTIIEVINHNEFSLKVWIENVPYTNGSGSNQHFGWHRIPFDYELETSIKSVEDSQVGVHVDSNGSVYVVSRRVSISSYPRNWSHPFKDHDEIMIINNDTVYAHARGGSPVHLNSFLEDRCILDGVKIGDVVILKPIEKNIMNLKLDFENCSNE